MIAILLATYNGEKYIFDQLESIRTQTYQDFICFIHDDGSKDKTRTIVKNYCQQYPEHFKEVEGPPTGGSKNNFFFLLKNVESDYYMFSDQDDIWLENKLSVLMGKMREIENDKTIPTLTFSDMEVVNETLDQIHYSFMNYNRLDPKDLRFCRLVVQNVAAGCTMLFNRTLRDESLKYGNIEKIRWHDWWLVLISSGKGKIEYVDQRLQLYRQHSNNSIGADKEIGINKIIKLIWWTITLSHIRTTKDMIQNFVLQAAELDEKQFCGDNRKIILVMKRFYQMNKIKRIRCFRRFDIGRNKRNLWMQICL